MLTIIHIDGIRSKLRNVPFQILKLSTKTNPAKAFFFLNEDVEKWTPFLLIENLVGPVYLTKPIALQLIHTAALNIKHALTVLPYSNESIIICYNQS